MMWCHLQISRCPIKILDPPEEVWATTVHELRVAYQNQLAKAEDSD